MFVVCACVCVLSGRGMIVIRVVFGEYHVVYTSCMLCVRVLYEVSMRCVCVLYECVMCCMSVVCVYVH